MTVQMDKAFFDSLAVSAVGHACFEPMIPAYRASMRGGPENGIADRRAEFFKTLTPGQRALFFFSYYDHAIRSEAEFRSISEHFLSQKIFGIVTRGAEYFRDTGMLSLLLAIAEAVASRDESEFPRLYQELRELSPKTLNIIGAFIRENPAAFVSFEP